ncbi:MAG: ABC transporter ATP-binding protein [candidate division Zixibacteria bacterium]|nr:ABC transporter ATP-binding protein [candidate division Zixibacteria bacterium]MDD5426403.1 ABC transporter ATP-binding protein [candidate division Zixibacteria bacterium]
MYKLSVINLTKRFGFRKVFTDISFELETGRALAVVGPNGSGKTTLLLTLLGGFRPNKGTVTFQEDERVMPAETIRDHTALVAPYLNFYDNLTAEENLIFFSAVSGGRVTGKELTGLLEQVGLAGRGDDPVGSYSSGMKQRLKFAAAILKQPQFLFLDEPTSNLDNDGKKMVFDLINGFKSRSILVLATNEKEEQQLAEQVCRLDR